MANKECCENCKFYSPPPKDRKFGNCRRYPPISIEMSSSDSDSGNARFPRIKETGWCGEWKSIITKDDIEQLKGWAQDA